jgi:hypothetical protein
MEFKASEAFWKSFNALSSSQKESVRHAWKRFKLDPFHPSLGTHRIHRLSALHKTTVYSVVIEGNLRVVFKMSGDVVFTIDVGTHALYG